MKKKNNTQLTIRDVIITSRPFSWINTAVPFLVGYLIATPSFDWKLIIGTIYFTFSYNLLLYGVNDIFDYESDIKNPRKGSKEGGLVAKNKHRMLWYSIAITNLPFIIFLLVTSPLIGQIWLIITIALCFTYSAKPFRFKEVPIVDSINSSLHFVSPLIFGLLYAHAINLPWPGIIAFLFWGMASQAFGSIQDIGPDRAAHIRSIATQLGARITNNYALILYSVSCAIVALWYFPWGLGAAIILGVYALNVSFFRKYRSDAKSPEFRRGWNNFMWLNLFAGFWLAQLLLFSFDPFNAKAYYVQIIAGFLILFGIVQLVLTLYNYISFRRPKTKRMSELPHIGILMQATGEIENLSSSLLALVGQNYPHFDVYIADYSSQEQTKDIVQGYQDKRLHYIDIESAKSGWHHNAWVAQQLLDQTNSELTVMINGDTILLPNTLSIIASLFDQNSLDLVSLLPADQNKSFWQQLIMSQEHYFLMSLYPAAIMTKYFPKLVTAYSPFMAFKKSAIEKLGGFQAVRKSPLEALDIANLAHQKGLTTMFYTASDLALSQNRSNLKAILQQTSQRLYPSLRFNMPLTLTLFSGGVFVLLVPPVLLATLVLSGMYNGTILLAIACVVLLCNRFVVAFRSKQSLIGSVLYPIGCAILLGCMLNSLLRYELRKPRWQTRTEL